MNKKLLQILVCPLCKGRLQYNKMTTELVCDKDKLAFPIRAGVPVLLAMDARQITEKDK